MFGNNTPDNTDSSKLAMVKMNLNPSISFVVDGDNKVVSVTGENNEGKMIIAGEEIVGKDLAEAIEIILTIENETGYLVSGNVTFSNMIFRPMVTYKNYFNFSSKFVPYSPSNAELYQLIRGYHP